MSKKLIFVAVFVFLMATSVDLASAQSATGSANSTSSATASNSASSTRSATATSSATTLPRTGAHDVLILFFAGLIFLAAGVTTLSGTKQVFAELEEQAE